MTQDLTVIYGRVSSEAQARDDKVSLGDQENRCRSGLETIGVTDKIRVFLEDHSGFDFNRPKLDEIKTLIKRGRVKRFVALRVDRVTRKAGHLDELREGYFLPYNVEVYTFGDIGKWGWGLFDIHLQNSLVNFAELWGKMVVAVMNDGKMERLRNGNTFCAGKPPLGYDEVTNDKGKRTLVKNDIEAQIVKDIFHWFVVDGLSIRQIVKRLKENGTPTYLELRGWSPIDYDTRKKDKNMKSSWRHATVHKILTNKTYTGVWTYGKRKRGKQLEVPIIEVPVPRIISDEIFEEAQRRLRKNKKQKSGRRPKFDYLMAKRMTCVCNHAMTVCNRNNGRNLYYRCPGSTNDNWERCDKVYFNATLVDEIAWNWLNELLEDKEKMKNKIEEYIATIEEEIKPHQERRDVLKVLKEKAESKQQKYLDMFENDAIDQSLLIPRLEELKKRIDDYDEELYDLETKLENLTLWLEPEYVDRLHGFIAAGFEIDYEGSYPALRVPPDQQQSEFEKRLAKIEQYDVRGRILFEDGEYYIKLTSRYGHVSKLSIKSSERRMVNP